MKQMVKCPHCGKRLEIKDASDLAGKRIKCPVCGTVNSYESFLKAFTADAGSDETRLIDDQRTIIPGLGNIRLPRLVFVKTGQEYPLKEGRQLVGRKPKESASEADVQVDTHGENFMSRSHFYIDVKKASNGSYRAYISNAANKNETVIGNEVLRGTDVLALSDGDVIRICSTEIRIRF